MPPRSVKRGPPPSQRGKAATHSTVSAARRCYPSQSKARPPSQRPSHPPSTTTASQPVAPTPSPSPAAAAASSTTATQTRGFAYLSPEVLAASRFGSADKHAGRTPSPQAAAAATAPVQPLSVYPSARRPPSAAVRCAKGSLAHLRAMAGADAQQLSVAAPASPLLYRNEESPGPSAPPSASSQSTAPPTEPVTPQTPELVRRLASLNGTSYDRAIAVMHVDRLKRARLAAAAAQEAAGSGAVAGHASRRSENEEEEDMERRRRLRAHAAAAATATAGTAAAAARGDGGDDHAAVHGRHLDNEEEEAQHNGGGRAAPVPATSSTLDRLRAASRTVVSPVASPLPPPSSLASSFTSAPFAGAAAAAVVSPSMGVTERLSQLRQRASASAFMSAPASVAAAAAAVAPTPPADATAGCFMNLERMQVGHSSSGEGGDLRSHSPYSGTGAQVQGGGPWGVVGSEAYPHRAAGHTLPPPASTGALPQPPLSSPSPPHTPVPPTAVDGEPGAVEAADAMSDLNRYLHRYQSTVRQSPWHTAANGATQATEATRLSGVARRSQRRQSAAAAKKESAVTTLVRGRKSSQRQQRAITSAHVVNHLRQLAAKPVPIGETTTPAGEGGREERGESPSTYPSALPPSWSSGTPFAAQAGSSLYGMLSSAAQRQRASQYPSARRRLSSSGPAHRSSSVGGSTGASGSGSRYPSEMRRAAALTTYPSQLQKTPPSSSLSVSPSSSASGQCVVFDTSSLLDSEPAVLNLLLEKAHIGIPFKVVDELDYFHKGATGGGDLPVGGVGGGMRAALASLGRSASHDKEWCRRRAHELRNWIAACMQRHEPHLLLQKRAEVIEAYDRHTATNDDQILGYAVYLRRHRGKVIFVTEDKFLRIKAAAEMGTAYSYAEVRQMVGMVPLQPSAAAVKPVMQRRSRAGK